MITDDYPTELRARATSCGCAECIVGAFDTCLDQAFHGQWMLSPLVITVVQNPPPQALLRRDVIATIRRLGIAKKTCAHHLWPWDLTAQNNYDQPLFSSQVIFLFAPFVAYQA